MARPLQKRKLRSSRPLATIRKPRNPRKPRGVLGNAMLAARWDKHATLAQNYARLGLAARINGASGGVEARGVESNGGGGEDIRGEKAAGVDLNLKTLAAPKSGGMVREVEVVRDEDGRIVEIVGRGNGQKVKRANPLADLLAEMEEDEDDEGEDAAANGAPLVNVEGQVGRRGAKTETIRQLEEMAKIPGEKRLRTQSEREQEWCRALVEKYGEEDVQGMFRDRKLNLRQQSVGDIKRRIRKFLSEGGKE